MYSDASGSYTRGGFGALCEEAWMSGVWNYDFVQRVKPSIEYLELYALTAGVLQWIHRFRNMRIYLFCNKKSVRDMVNSSSARCRNCMVLIRLITLKSLMHNVRIKVKYVESHKNVLTDALSRGQWQRLWDKAPEYTNEEPDCVPEAIWPMEKIWIYSN